VQENNLRRLYQLISRYTVQHAHQVTIEELESAFSTSRRNTSNVLRELDSLGWIDWTPAVGRGKPSELFIRVTFASTLFDVIKRQLNEGRFDLISKLLTAYGDLAARILASAVEEQNTVNKSNNRLLVARYPWVDELDPAVTIRRAELHIISSLYDTLVQQDSFGNIVAGVAHEWRVVEQEIIFYLRDRVQRHDGLYLSVNDVAWSLERLKHAQCPVSPIFQSILSVTVLGEHSLSVKLAEKNPLFLYALATPHASILCPEKTPFSKKHYVHIGTGAFKVSEWDSEKLTLQRHTQYFQKNALLDQVTLSHAGEEITSAMSFNQESGEKSVSSINAYSYLSYRPRPNAGITPSRWYQIADYIRACKYHYDPENVVEGACHYERRLIPARPLSLQGKVVLAEPQWTLPQLRRLANWLHECIRATGVELEVHEYTEINNPEYWQGRADLLLVEEVIEFPLEYGVYEWLMISTGLRFALNREQLSLHRHKVAQCAGRERPLAALRQIENRLYDQFTCVALFNGVEELSCLTQVQGIGINATGYSDFKKLWVEKPQN